MAMSLVASIDSADGTRTNAVIDANALYLMSATRMTRVRLDTFAISHNLAFTNLYSNIIQDDNFLYVASTGASATLYKLNKSDLTTADSRNIVNDPNTVDFPRTIGIAFNHSKTRIHCAVTHNTGLAATNKWKTEYTTSLTIAAGPTALPDTISVRSLKGFHTDDGHAEEIIMYDSASDRVREYLNVTLTGLSTAAATGSTAHVFTGPNRVIQTGGRPPDVGFISNASVKVWTSVPVSGTDLGLITTYTESGGNVAGAVFDDNSLFCFLGVGTRSVRKVLRTDFSNVEYAENIAPGTGSPTAIEAMVISTDNQFLYAWQSGTTSRVLKIGGLEITTPAVPISGGPNVKRRPYPYNGNMISNGGW